MNLVQCCSNNQKKYTIIIMIVLVTALSFVSFFDIRSDQYFDKALKQAAVSFGLSKTLNAAVSVVQDIDLSAEPLGFGISVGAGESLDPVNDMIEKFSNIMFASTISLGVQNILSEVGRCVFIKVVLGLISVLTIIYLLIDNIPARESVSIILGKLLILFIVLRFALPIVSIINNQVYHTVLKEKMESEMKKIEIITGEISNLDVFNTTVRTTDEESVESSGENQNQQNPITTEEVDNSESKSGIMGNVGKIWNSTKETTGNVYESATDSMGKTWTGFKKNINLKEVEVKIVELKDKVSEASSYLVDLAIIFVFQTIVSPLIVLWGMAKLTGYLMVSKS